MENEINIGYEIERLIKYGLYKNLVNPEDVSLLRNELMGLLDVREAYGGDVPNEAHKSPSEILNIILLYSYRTGLIPDNSVVSRDNFSARIMGKITPLPSVVIKNFNNLYEISPMDATDYLYALLCDVNFIHMARAKKNFHWGNDEEYGTIQLTNNFQGSGKREADDNSDAKMSIYPECEICAENVGFAGNAFLRASQNQRIIPLKLLDETFYLQYPPEQYYSERCYVTCAVHKPLTITRKTFGQIMSFVEQFPHYFLGFNATLPQLSNDHNEHYSFQGGGFVMPIEYAETIKKFKSEEFSGVEFGILKWPVSTIRCESGDEERLINAAEYIASYWGRYSDESMGILSESSSVSAVARRNARGCFELDIMLRNAAFVPNHDCRQIPCESIGIMEAMGFAAFPETYDNMLLYIIGTLLTGKKYEEISSIPSPVYSEWSETLRSKYGTVSDYGAAKQIVTFEAARKFSQMLDDSGVFKMNDFEAFEEFAAKLGLTEADY